jgi:outer membrane protein assembly factor BamB
MARMIGPGRHAVHPRDHVPLWVAAVVAFAAMLAFASVVTGVGSGMPAAPRPPADAATAEPINTTFPGVTTFGGNDSRSYHGRGPVPSDPVIRWQYPQAGSPLCSLSAEGRDPSELKEWCGTGWTGQPNVVPAGDGMQVRIGAYDGAYHFLDAGRGSQTLPPLPTDDLAKGSATTDPDGYPLYYGGSRDNRFRVVALDRERPTVLWELDARTSAPFLLDGVNDDWDAAPLVVGDHLLQGGENGWFYVIRLHRDYDVRGQVTVDPEIVATIQGWDDRLLTDVGDEDVSIESSVALHDGVAYFANSGGLVQGWDVSDILGGGDRTHQVFRFWTGDDTDASIVVDDEGYLYVASQYQRFLSRSREIGQLMKLDPRAGNDPVLWSIPALERGFHGAGGSWSTPALFGDRVYFTTAAGRVMEVDRATGAIVWEHQIGAPTIGSPVVVDGVLLQADCSGHLYAWDLTAAGSPPPLLWRIELGDCIESTPTVWDGWIYLGTREGYLYGIADEATPAPTAGTPAA